MGWLALRLVLGALAAAAGSSSAAAASTEEPRGRRSRGAKVPPGGKVSLSDIEASLRSIGGGAAQSLNRSALTTTGAAVGGGMVLAAAAYLYGRRRGRHRATVLEIHRVT